ncbi:hypothetical protein [Paludisphaera soli]|uniref:hypothetical protein n=1 Tax=Paludisphaera soli TaxID=2712865 RepID=UPI0013EC5867|nr:hypothetical protein [Paludisphaera soli]
MTTRTTKLVLRTAPWLAWLIVCAASSSRSLADCAHPAGATAMHRASASLQILELGEADDATTWAVPGRPCTGPRCKSKAPSADAPAPPALPDRDDGCLALVAIPRPAADPTATAWVDPLLTPTLASLALERPPRSI